MAVQLGEEYSYKLKVNTIKYNGTNAHDVVKFLCDQTERSFRGVTSHDITSDSQKVSLKITGPFGGDTYSDEKRVFSDDFVVVADTHPLWGAKDRKAGLRIAAVLQSTGGKEWFADENLVRVDETIQPSTSSWVQMFGSGTLTNEAHSSHIHIQNPPTMNVGSLAARIRKELHMEQDSRDVEPDDKSLDVKEEDVAEAPKWRQVRVYTSLLHGGVELVADQGAYIVGPIELGTRGVYEFYQTADNESDALDVTLFAVAKKQFHAVEVIETY